MRKITCIAIDDEPIALLVIQQFCERKGNIKLTTYYDPVVGMEAILREKPDLVFLDVEMDNINGLEIGKKLPRECCLIFTTAHARYALDGFNLDAVDFLHKPIAYERFVRAIEKAMIHIEACHNDEQETIVVKQEYNNVSIFVDDILYVEALENYSKIYRIHGSCVISRLSIKNIHEMLPANIFLRIHRSFLVSVKHIQKFSRREIWLGGLLKPIPIGRSYVEEVFFRLSHQLTNTSI